MSQKADHALLARLIEMLSQVCAHIDSDTASCEHCPADQIQQCRSSLRAASGKITFALVTHIIDEDERMLAMPHTREVAEHCETHRREHVRFTTNFNHAVKALDPDNIAASSHRLSDFLSTWMRAHVIEFDAQLDALNHQHPKHRNTATHNG